MRTLKLTLEEYDENSNTITSVSQTLSTNILKSYPDCDVVQLTIRDLEYELDKASKNKE
jgi:hypothetical protein